MNKLHEKSPCCGGKIWRRNNRRRQCSVCRKTWRSWKRKPGRKRERYDLRLLLRYLENKTGRLSEHARKRQLTPEGLYARLGKTLNYFNRITPWPGIPEGELIAVADAMVEYLEGIPHIIYFILLRPVFSNKAVIMPFSVRGGEGEGWNGWSNAFSSLPEEVLSRIRVLVCDGMTALGKMAREKGWILQRCQFHLIARISHNCSSRRLGKRPELGRHIQKLTHTILTSKKEPRVQEFLQKLRRVREKIRSRMLRSVLSGFIKHYGDYRAYLNYPYYNLPTTSNSAESLIGQIRDLQYRARGFSSLTSLCSWIEAMCKHRKEMTCNAKIYSPN